MSNPNPPTYRRGRTRLVPADRLTTGEVLAASGVPAPTLERWILVGRVRPQRYGKPGTGRGTFGWTAADVVQIRELHHRNRRKRRATTPPSEGHEQA